MASSIHCSPRAHHNTANSATCTLNFCWVSAQVCLLFDPHRSLDAGRKRAFFLSDSALVLWHSVIVYLCFLLSVYFYHFILYLLAPCGHTFVLFAVSIYSQGSKYFWQVYVASLYCLTSLVLGCIFADKNTGVFSDSWQKPSDSFISYLYVKAMVPRSVVFTI